MGDLVVTISEVRDLGDKLRLVATEFESCEDIAEDYASCVSHGDLAHELEEFADNWSAHRSKMMDGLKEFADKAKEAADAYQGIEDELVRALEGGG